MPWFLGWCMTGFLIHTMCWCFEIHLDLGSPERIRRKSRGQHVALCGVSWISCFRPSCFGTYRNTSLQWWLTGVAIPWFQVNCYKLPMISPFCIGSPRRSLTFGIDGARWGLRMGIFWWLTKAKWFNGHFMGFFMGMQRFPESWGYPVFHHPFLDGIFPWKPHILGMAIYGTPFLTNTTAGNPTIRKPAAGHCDPPVSGHCAPEPQGLQVWDADESKAIDCRRFGAFIWRFP